MSFPEKVDDRFVKLLTISYVRAISSGGKERVKEAGVRIGSRLADDFYIRCEAKRTEDEERIVKYICTFFTEYFNFQPLVEGLHIKLPNFILEGEMEIAMISGILEHIISYVSIKRSKIEAIGGDELVVVIEDAGKAAG